MLPCDLSDCLSCYVFVLVFILLFLLVVCLIVSSFVSLFVLLVVSCFVLLSVSLFVLLHLHCLSMLFCFVSCFPLCSCYDFLFSGHYFSVITGRVGEWEIIQKCSGNCVSYGDGFADIKNTCTFPRLWVLLQRCMEAINCGGKRSTVAELLHSFCMCCECILGMLLFGIFLLPADFVFRVYSPEKRKMYSMRRRWQKKKDCWNW